MDRSSASQIDFFSTRRVDRDNCIDCKVVLSESVVTQHRLLVLDVRIRMRFRKIKCKSDPKVKWWRLKESNQGVFVDRVVHETDWKFQDDPSITWNKIASCIKRIAKDVLGESWGGAPPCKGTSWWNEEVKTFIMIKRNSYRDLKKYCDGVSFERYKLAKEAKKAIKNARVKCTKKCIRSWTPKKLKMYI